MLTLVLSQMVVIVTVIKGLLRDMLWKLDSDDINNNNNDALWH